MIPDARLASPGRRAAFAGYRGLVLVLVSIALSALLYSDFPRIDTGALWFHDDNVVLNAVADGLSLDALFPRGMTAITPALMLVYAALHGLVGRLWWPYGAVLIAGHAAMCSMIGIAVLRFTRSFWLATQVVVLTTVAFALRPDGQFVMVLVYVLIVSVIGAVVLVKQFLESGSGLALAGVVGVMMLAPYVSARGPLVFPIVALFTGGFLLVARADAEGPALVLARTRRVLLATGVTGAGYGLVALYAIVGRGYPWPWQVQHGEAEATAQFARFAQAVSYGSIAWYPFTGFTVVPSFVQEYGLALFLVEAGALGLGLWLVATRLRRIDRSRRETLVCACLWFVVAMVYGAVAVAGRQSMPLSHLRYGAFVAVFAVLAVAHGLGWFALGPKGTRLATLSGLTALTVWLVFANVAAIRDWTREHPRTPGQWFDARTVDPPVEWIAGGGPPVGPGVTDAVRARSERRIPVPSGVEIVISCDRIRFGAMSHLGRRARPSLVIQVTGRYLVAGHVTFEQEGRGTRVVSIVVNGAEVLGRREARPGGDDPAHLTVVGLRDLSQGDTVELRAYQDSGRVLEILGGTSYGAELGLARLGSARPAAETGAEPRPSAAAAQVAHTGTSPLPDREWVALAGAGPRAPQSGLYVIVARVGFAPDPEGSRHAILEVKGESVIAWQSTRASPSGPTRLVIGAVAWLRAGDIVELRVLQDSGGPLPISPDGPAELLVVSPDRVGEQAWETLQALVGVG